MARPPTQRRIAEHLEARVFKPAGVPARDLAAVTLSLDGLEAIRLADLRGLYHVEAASRMAVSRQTFERVLEGARRTVAQALVEGLTLEIGGGAFARGPDREGPCPVHGRRRRGRRCGCPDRGGWDAGAGRAGKEEDMPRMDGTGPRGEGPRTGRGMGRCGAGPGGEGRPREGMGAGGGGGVQGGAGAGHGGQGRRRRRFRGGRDAAHPETPGGAS